MHSMWSNDIHAMYQIPCMRDATSSTNYKVVASNIQRTQRQICGIEMVQYRAMVPSKEVVPVETSTFTLRCVHSNLIFEDEKQVLQHGHILQFRRKYKIENAVLILYVNKRIETKKNQVSQK